MKTTTLLKTVCYLSLFSVSLAIAAPLKQTTPTKNFIDNKDGTVTHKKTGLTWQRCAMGQTWTGTTCSGSGTSYTYDEAMALKSNFAGKKDWRVPTSNELSSILEYASLPVIVNTKVFPNTPSEMFWSSLPMYNIAVLPFVAPYLDQYNYDGSYAVRLVR